MIDPDDLAFRVTIANAPDDLLLNRQEVAAYLGVSPQTISNGVSTGRFPPPHYIGGMKRGMTRWRLGDIRAAIKTKENAQDDRANIRGALSDG